MDFLDETNPTVDWITQVQFWSFKKKKKSHNSKNIPEKENSSAMIVFNYNLLHLLFYLCIKVLAQ